MKDQNRLLSGDAGLPNLSYYDLLLLAVPLPLLFGLFAGTFSSLSPHSGLLAGGVLSAMTIGHLLFGDPPTRRGPRGRIKGPSA
jgi:hypothetical protein